MSRFYWPLCHRDAFMGMHDILPIFNSHDNYDNALELASIDLLSWQIVLYYLPVSQVHHPIKGYTPITLPTN